MELVGRISQELNWLASSNYRLREEYSAIDRMVGQTQSGLEAPLPPKQVCCCNVL